MRIRHYLPCPPIAALPAATSPVVDMTGTIVRELSVADIPGIALDWHTKEAPLEGSVAISSMDWGHMMRLVHRPDNEWVANA